MIIAHPYYFDPISLSDNSPFTIVIENTVFFRKMILEFYSSYENDYGDFVLSENNEILSISKNCLLINDFFNLDFSNRQLKTKINQELSVLADEDILQKTLQQLTQLGESVSLKFPAPISYNVNVTIGDILKLLDFQYDLSEMNEIEKILEYITSNYDLLQKKLIVTINLKEFLTDHEFSEFTKYLSYKKIPLLLFEQRVHNTDDHNRTIIIDQDLCIL